MAMGIPKTGKVIPENERLVAAKPEPRVSACLKLLLMEIKNTAND